ncbi:MAG TPA: metalloregulator ArsR/SmtB family transcription factor [Bryobacteraceae bacterium]|nr:metalloregulator ArsR/SmtB family transcription factor [Bryobacteraceae bacterium]
MQSLLKSLRLLADPSRVRLLLLLEREELSVAELQDILSKGQSQISTHLAQLKQAGLVQDRRNGKNILYRLKQGKGGEGDALAPLLELLHKTAGEIPEIEQDEQAVALILKKRQDKMQSYFDGLAGKFGREYLPGRSWKGLAEALLMLMPPLVIADLGAGEGTFSQLLARRAKHVIAVDRSEKMVEFGASLAEKHDVENLEYRQGDMEELPISDGEVDLTFFSQSLHHAQHPERAVAEAWRILKPGGRIAVLDLVRHQFEEARELYADLWLGFSELELQNFLAKAGFRNVHTAVVHREPESPHFETLLAVGDKA